MNSIHRIRTVGLALVAIGMASSVQAGAPAKPVQSVAKCDKISKDVYESVSKAPAKVLMIVEDALVINESCACEIVKAAITASKADTAMVKQIVQTAVAVAPKMTPVIMDCANMSSPGSAEVVTTSKVSGKDAKNVQPVKIEPPKEDGADFTGGGVDAIRGVYLMSPSVGGFMTNQDNETNTSTHTKSPRPPRKNVTEPLSPSEPDPCSC